MAREGLRRRIAKSRDSNITFMSIPNGRGGVRTITTSQFNLYALFFLFLSLFMTFFSVYFIVLRKYHISRVMLDRQMAEMKFLRDEKEQLYVVTAKQRGELETLYEHSIELARRLDRLEGFKVEIENIIHKVPSTPPQTQVASLPPEEGQMLPDARGGRPFGTDSLFLETQGMVGALMGQTPEKEEDMIRLKSAAVEYKRRYDHTPTIWPLEGRITSRFGPRTHPITKKPDHHTGIDIAVPVGTPVKAVADGVVHFSGWSPGYGYTIILDHDYGLQTLYAHNSKLLVGAGTVVKKGQIVAHSGNTGNSTGPHLHFEIIRRGQAIDPMTYLK